MKFDNMDRYFEQYDINLDFYATEWSNQYRKALSDLEVMAVLGHTNFLGKHELISLLEQKMKDVTPTKDFIVVTNDSTHSITMDGNSEPLFVFDTVDTDSVTVGILKSSENIFADERELCSKKVITATSLILGMSELYEDIKVPLATNCEIKVYFLDYDFDKKNFPTHLMIQIKTETT